LLFSLPEVSAKETRIATHLQPGEALIAAKERKDRKKKLTANGRELARSKGKPQIEAD
jgi:hypothetical protein